MSLSLISCLVSLSLALLLSCSWNGEALVFKGLLHDPLVNLTSNVQKDGLNRLDVLDGLLYSTLV